MKQSCYFVKLCDGEFNKKHIGVTLFSLQLCVRELILKMCGKGTKYVSRNIRRTCISFLKIFLVELLNSLRKSDTNIDILTLMSMIHFMLS